MRKIPHFHDVISGLSEEIQQEIRTRIVTRHYKAGDIVLSQGQTVSETYRIHSGKTKISTYTEDGREIILSNLNAGDTFGENGVLDGIPSAYSVECLTDTTIGVLDGEDFMQFFKQYPECAYELCKKLNRHVRILYELLVEAKSMPLQKRVVSKLFRGMHSHTANDEHGLYVDMSQDELARMLGTARQTLNRELKKLEALEYISIKNGKIYFSDIKRMREDFKDIIHADFMTPYY